MSEIVAKLDSYLSSLEEVYGDISSDEEVSAKGRTSFYPSTDGTNTSRVQLLGHKRHGTTMSDDESQIEMSEYPTVAMDQEYSDLGKGKDGKGKRKVSTDPYTVLSENYGAMPDESN